MSVLYIHLSGFIFADKKADAKDKMYIIIKNNTNGAAKAFNFTSKTASTIRKSYNLKTASGNNQSITIQLFSKNLFKDEMIGYVDILLNSLPVDKCTRNNLVLTPVNNQTKPIVLRAIMHLAQNCKPYKCEMAESQLLQIDLSVLKFYKKERAEKNVNVSSYDCSFDEDSIDSPLFSQVVF